MSTEKQKDQQPAQKSSRSKEEAIARLVREHPEKAAEILREVLKGRA